MTEPRQPYIVATATGPFNIKLDESVTLVTTKRKAALVHRVETLSNQHKRGEVARFAVVDLESLEIGSIIAFET
jgi:hypothetical protein